MKLLLFFFSLISCSFLSAQLQDTSYIYPLKLPISFSGNFGEIRGTHFHAGLDFKTQQTIGHAVHVVKDGVVSRVAVSLGGYGWVVYVDHPDGNTSVYGHLSKFSEKIGRIVRQIQYQNKRFEMDENFLPYHLVVHQNEVIAYSGNTGGSEAPHLHFEIRNTLTKRPQNVLRFFYGSLPDNKPPVIKGIMVYGEQVDKRIKCKYFSLVKHSSLSHNYTLNKHPEPVQVAGVVSFGVEAYDQLSGSSNKCGIYSMQAWVDDSLIYEHKIDELDFSTVRCVHSFVDYSYRIKTNKKIQRTHIDPNNQLNIYSFASQDLLFNAKKHKIKIVVGDAKGNESTASFIVVGKPLSASNVVENPLESASYIDYSQAAHFHFNELVLDIPANAFFENQDSFTFNKYQNQVQLPFQVAQMYCLLSKFNPPLLKEASLKIAVPDSLKEFKNKLYWGLVNKGYVNAVNTTCENDTLESKIRFWGNYSLFIDTVPPVVIPKNIVQLKDMSKESSIEFTIADHGGSGIESYNGYIDGNWVLFAYEPKEKRLYYSFDAELFKSTGEKHHLLLLVEDAKKNVSTFNLDFIY